ncbi:MAG TPA: 2-C-methyl-D-erythritol 2,4-cyclodiphosphate synthase [Kiritimatiellia bacterium]|mgnify:CR=1 FL=1|nr:2-C-methyl-D-erythritol 2,4-cyclodiphosphate synthase [Kiritimatiellia bacterium]HRU69617.1 2-C-methyl-D-erythritol 2,4-cyclodiphosphate synthase [Kiritimatiellia bacterium]
MIRTGIGYDSHRLVEGRRLVLGGVEIPHTSGLLGHSDADVLIHALCDALLGAVADGDIGQHFSDRDPQWKGADSTVLLRRVVERLKRSGWSILNTDATVMAEAPHLAPYVPAMRAWLAEVMGIELARVSVKAKSNEGMGAVGRREGIAVMAVATVCRSSVIRILEDQ